MKNEADVKREVKKILKKLGIWYFMPVPTGYGVQGISDFICCDEGKFLAIETKFGNNKLTKWQRIRLDEIAEHGGRAMVVNEENVVDLERKLLEWRE